MWQVPLLSSRHGRQLSLYSPFYSEYDVWTHGNFIYPASVLLPFSNPVSLEVPNCLPLQRKTESSETADFNRLAHFSFDFVLAFILACMRDNKKRHHPHRYNMCVRTAVILPRTIFLFQLYKHMNPCRCLF